ncbi:MAG: DNA polymerase III subunit delta [Anaerolineales bacterium]
MSNAFQKGIRPSIVSEPSADSKPTVYLLYGDNDFAIARAVQSLTEQFDDPSTAQLNTECLDGRQVSLGKLQEISHSIPFLAPRRLVIVDHADQLATNTDERSLLDDILDQLPPSTALVLVDLIDLSRRGALDRYRQRSHLFQWAKDHSGSAYNDIFQRPAGGAFVRWVQDHCRSLGGEIQSQAAALLADFVADDLYLADQEVQKLLDYVDYQRPIEADDVERLTPFYGQPDVFAMVDAIGGRDAGGALAYLHRLLQDEDPRYAFAMIIRQFRLLIQAREALDEGADPKTAMDEHPFVVNKISGQARNFSLSQLERIYQHLLRVDVDSKIGRADVPTALDLLIVGLSS